MGLKVHHNQCFSPAPTAKTRSAAKQKHAPTTHSEPIANDINYTAHNGTYVSVHGIPVRAALTTSPARHQ